MSTTSVLANEFAIDYAGNAFFIALNERAHILHTRRAAGARRNYACGVGMDSVLSVDVQSATDGTVLAVCVCAYAAHNCFLCRRLVVTAQSASTSSNHHSRC
jgi:hypothetical protein